MLTIIAIVDLMPCTYDILSFVIVTILLSRFGPFILSNQSLLRSRTLRREQVDRLVAFSVSSSETNRSDLSAGATSPHHLRGLCLAEWREIRYHGLSRPQRSHRR